LQWKKTNTDCSIEQDSNAPELFSKMYIGLNLLVVFFSLLNVHRAHENLVKAAAKRRL
jgi:hypothetical protein